MLLLQNMLRDLHGNGCPLLVRRREAQQVKRVAATAVQRQRPSSYTGKHVTQAIHKELADLGEVGDLFRRGFLFKEPLLGRYAVEGIVPVLTAEQKVQPSAPARVDLAVAPQQA